MPDMGAPTKDALRFAESFFHGRLTEKEEGQRAFQYLGQRGYGRSVIEAYGLGWAPDSWDALLKAATAEGFSRETLVEAGLIKPRKSSGHYDRFRNRLIFPLYSQDRTPLGFAGRLLAESEDAPKYINSPATEHYDKDRYLYGLWRAHSSIEEVGTALVVEGYTDVITLQDAGLVNVVASSGTALTRTQARMISRAATTVVFAYDPDEAGVVASIRGMKRALAAGLRPGAVLLPGGKDPHDFCRERGLEETRWHLEKEIDGLPAFMKWADEEGMYDPEPSLEAELTEAANGAASEPLRQMLLLDAARRLGVHDRELFAGGSPSEELNLATQDGSPG